MDYFITVPDKAANMLVISLQNKTCKLFLTGRHVICLHLAGSFRGEDASYWFVRCRFSNTRLLVFWSWPSCFFSKRLASLPHLYNKTHSEWRHLSVAKWLRPKRIYLLCDREPQSTSKDLSTNVETLILIYFWSIDD